MMNTEYTYDDELVSDFHKDAYGFRPSESYWEWWVSCTPDEKQAEWKRLGEAMDAREAERREEEANAIEQFEEQIYTLMECGARDRAMAIRWLDEAYETNGDMDFLAYNLGLPYRYLTKTVTTVTN